MEIRESYPTYLRYFEIIIVIVFLIYILLPAGLSAETYFRIRGLETSIIEFEFLIFHDYVTKSEFINYRKSLIISTNIGQYERKIFRGRC